MLTRRGFLAAVAGTAAAGALTGLAAAGPVASQGLRNPSFSKALLLRERWQDQAEHARLHREIVARLERMKTPIWTLDGTTPPMPPGLVEQAPEWVWPR